jgi:hypothetical protein
MNANARYGGLRPKRGLRLNFIDNCPLPDLT